MEMGEAPLQISAENGPVVVAAILVKGGEAR